MYDDYLFVYGTLRKEKGNALHRIIAEHSVYCGGAVMQGKLFEIGGYPGAVESDNPNDKVLGELYRLLDSDTVLRQLDEYEECSDHFVLPHEYLRKKINVEVSGGKHILAWVYIYNHDIADREIITSGDYLHPFVD